MTAILTVTKGHNSVNNVVGVQVPVLCTLPDGAAYLLQVL